MHDWVQASFAQRRWTSATKPADEPVEVDGNAVMLREMLSNLIDNAMRYTPAGGTHHRARARDEAKHDSCISKWRTPASAFRAAERERVFERFYRILGREGDGSGLGLAIVREIATMHGGTLTIEDNVYQDIAPARRNAGARQLAAGLSGPGQTLSARIGRHDHTVSDSETVDDTLNELAIRFDRRWPIHPAKCIVITAARHVRAP